MTLLDLLTPLLTALSATLFVFALSAVLNRYKPHAAQKLAIWIAPATGFLAGGYFVRGFPRFPPIDAASWLYWTISLIAVIGFFVSSRFRPLQNAGRLTIASGLAVLILRPLIGRFWNGFESLPWIGGTAFLWFLVWQTLAHAIRFPQNSDRGKPLLLIWIATVGLSILLTASGIASYGLYVLALSGAIAAAGLASLPQVRKVVPDFRPAPALIAIPWMGFLSAGYFYADLRFLPMALSVLALATTLLLPQIPRLRKLKPVTLFTLQLLWLMALQVLALFQTLKNSPDFNY
jgi:hypothetical protein